MAGNTINVQGNYIDVHDNEVVNLNIDKATVTMQEADGDNAKTEGAAEPQMDDKPGDEELNFEAPKINLQQLLKQEWFLETRIEEKYDAAWTDAFVVALMASEYGEGIAREWAATRSCRDRIKGQVLGTLKDAGVLRGSYRQIARQVGIVVNKGGKDKKDPYKTFSDYMGRYKGRKPDYTEWVRLFVQNS